MAMQMPSKKVSGPAKPVSQPAVPVNLKQQVLLAVVLDRSMSMTTPCPVDPDAPQSAQTTPLHELQTALPDFKTQCASDPALKQCLSVGTVTFCETVSHAPFVPVTDWQPPTLEPGPGTSLGLAVNTALDLVVARRQELKEIGIPVHHTFVLVITDGADFSSQPELVDVGAERVRELEGAGRFSFLPVGIQDADLARLAVFTSKRKPAKLMGLKFAELFNWLFQSMREVSRTRIGDRVQYRDPVHSRANPDGWMESPG